MINLSPQLVPHLHTNKIKTIRQTFVCKPINNTITLPIYVLVHYKTLAAYRRLFLPLSGVFSGETTLRRFCKSPKKKRGKVAHRRFYKRRRVPTNAETRDAENNIIFRHTGVSRNASMSIILIIDIPAFWWNAGMLLFNINFFGVCRNAEKCLKIIKKNNFRPNLTLNWDENLVL